MSLANLALKRAFCILQVAKILLQNAQKRQRRPIVFICYTNHALDQILEHVHAFEKNIVRIGGRSK